ncbi:hypothetical protein Syun_012751 [Stephania yunnanensis]|uniref:Glycoprotease 1 n=1 Tax=Stephania yunnanensis TaxID=152371 RepID=A0AAP0PJR8_9MAGN
MNLWISGLSDHPNFQMVSSSFPSGARFVLLGLVGRPIAHPSLRLDLAGPVASDALIQYLLNITTALALAWILFKFLLILIVMMFNFSHKAYRPCWLDEKPFNASGPFALSADLVAKYGGVAPKMAEEAHLQVIDEVVQRALDEAKLTETDLSAVAVTIGPGLSLCLRVGVQKARKIAGRFCLPIVGIHHMEAHALVARLVDKNLQFPFLALLVSDVLGPGGHNLLILASDLGHYVQLGTTIDDAIGEAYDKIARWLGLDMRRAGPALEELAREGNDESIKFRVPMKQHKDCNFSYAGLKTQPFVQLMCLQIGFSDPDVPISSASCQDRTIRADIAASFQRVAVMHLEERCERAIEWALQIEPSIKSLVVSGGVASNQYLRIRLNQIVEQNGLRLVCPPPRLCTDNGVMIAWTGIEHFTRGRYDPPPLGDEPDDALKIVKSSPESNDQHLARAFIIHHGGLYNIPEKHSSEQTRTYVVNIIRNSSRHEACGISLANQHSTAEVKICIGFLFLLSSSLFMSVLKLGLPCLPNPHPLM